MNSTIQLSRATRGFAKSTFRWTRQNRTNLSFRRLFATIETEEPHDKALDSQDKRRKRFQLAPDHIVLPLKKGGATLFSLKSDMKVEDLYDRVADEDSSTQVQIRTLDGFKVSKKTSLSVLLQRDTKFRVNDEVFIAKPVHLSAAAVAPAHSIAAQPGVAQPVVAQPVVAQPIAGQPAGAASIKVINPELDETINELLSIQKELAPLEQRKAEVDALASTRARRVVWYGCAGLVAQWCFLARLTWWDLNWDIMEPVTYFITTGTGIVMYVYFAVVQDEFTYDTWFARTRARKQQRLYKKQNFDIDYFKTLTAKYDLLEKSLSPMARLKFRQTEFERNLAKKTKAE